jgi:uncharacterized protein YegP (UPF0339 family)
MTVSLPVRIRTNYAIELYKDSAGEHRWRMKSKVNGQIVAASSEGFSDERDAVRNCYLTTGYVPDDFVHTDQGVAERDD